MKVWLKCRLTGFCYGYLRGQADWNQPQAPEIRHARVLPEKIGDKLALLHIDVDVNESTRDILYWALHVWCGAHWWSSVTTVSMAVKGLPVWSMRSLLAIPIFAFLHNRNGHAVLVRVGAEVI